MDPATVAALISGGSRVLGAAASPAPVSSGINNSGFYGLGNTGWSVNLGGPGLNFQTGTPSGIPWGLVAAGAAVWFLFFRKG